VEFLEEDAKRMRGIETLDLRQPKSGEGVIGRGSDGFALKLGQEVLQGVIGETKIAGKELLIEDRSAEKAGDLLFFSGIAGQSEDVSEAGKEETGNTALERLKKHEFSIGERNNHVGLMKFDAIF
jgi:hypothetical protein